VFRVLIDVLTALIHVPGLQGAGRVLIPNRGAQDGRSDGVSRSTSLDGIKRDGRGGNDGRTGAKYPRYPFFHACNCF
jgi:hypothetical protein